MGTSCKDNIKVDLGSDQTSLHNPYAGGYYPVGMTLEESNKMMADDPDVFKETRFRLTSPTSNCH